MKYLNNLESILYELRQEAADIKLKDKDVIDKITKWHSKQKGKIKSMLDEMFSSSTYEDKSRIYIEYGKRTIHKHPLPNDIVSFFKNNNYEITCDHNLLVRPNSEEWKKKMRNIGITFCNGDISFCKRIRSEEN